MTTEDERAHGLAATPPEPWAPYREDSVTRSAGRTLLSDAFSNYMALTAGISPLEIASAFDEGGDVDDRDMIQREILFLAGIFLEGRIRTYARPSGGGEPTAVPASSWEIDDPVSRFATSAINLERPHDISAAPTHRIFVDNAEWEAAMDGLRKSYLPLPNEWQDDACDVDEAPAIAVVVASPAATDLLESGSATPGPDHWRREILNLASVMKATGLKRSTIYAKIGAGSFPKQVAIHGSRVGWRRGEVQDWLNALTS